MSDPSSLGVTASGSVATSLFGVYNSVFPAAQNATSIGYLSQDKTSINVMSQLDSNVSSDYYAFNFTSGSNMKLAFNTTTGLSTSPGATAAGTSNDAVSSNLRFQLYNNFGTLIADSGGTPAQQAAYASLTSSTGLAAPNTTYYAKISAAPGTQIKQQTGYNFQLYSGTTYTSSLNYSAQTQAYDPNLFKSASDTMTPASTLNTYASAATIGGTQAAAVNIGTLDANQSELYANSTLNSANQSAYYTFDFNSGTGIKFNLYNTTDPSLTQSLRVQLYDSNGNLVADSNGTESQIEAYKKLDSGEGLGAANGQYTAKISYAPGTFTSSAQQYNFQIYSGTTYNTQYKTSAALPTTTSTDTYGQNLGIFANTNAALYSRQEYHSIGETALGGVNLGWLSENKAASTVSSQLSHVDSKEFYNFTLQTGSNLKLAYTNQTGTSATRIQLLDQTGSYVIADNYGTDAQKAAFAQLTSSTGLKATPQSNYAIEVSYAPDADTTASQTYSMQLYSGTSYTSLYKFTASSQTYQNAVLSGNTNVLGYSTGSASAGYVASIAGGSDVNLLTDISTYA